MAERFTTILWDNDNTLMDFEYSLHKALYACFEAFNLYIDEKIIARYEVINTAYWKRLERGEVTKQQLLDGRFIDLFSELGYEVDVAEFRKMFQVELGSYFMYLDDSLEICKKLQGKVKQYIITNGVRETQIKKITAAGFFDIMEEIFISGDVGYEKPRKEFFDHCLEKIGEKDIDKVLIVGDSLTSDIAGGNNAGIKTCWYNPKGKTADSQYHIDYEINNLNQIFEVIYG
jgi:2-haloacid dehalogenase